MYMCANHIMYISYRSTNNKATVPRYVCIRASSDIHAWLLSHTSSIDSAGITHEKFSSQM